MKTFWNIVFTLFFIALVAGCFMYLAPLGRLTTDIPWTDLILLSLATFRLVRLFTYDHITAFVREGLATAGKGTFRGTLRDLLNCPWCTGIWFAFFTFAGYSLNRDVVMPVVLILSIAALASFFQIFANLVGWNAEDAKLDVTDHKAH